MTWRPWRAVRRAVRWCTGRCTALLDHWTPGLTVLGCSFWGVSAPWPWPEHRHSAVPADCPPPGHPERLCAHVPPTDVERELWSRLDLRA